MAPRTTITLDEDVRAKPEAEMRKSGKSFKETVNQTLRRGLFSRQQPPTPKPFQVKPRDLGLKPGYSYDKVWELIEEIEAAEYQSSSR